RDRRTYRYLALVTEPLDEAVDLARLRHVRDLEIAGDDGTVSEQPPEQRLLELDRPDALQPHRCGAPPHDAVDDEQLLGRQDDLRPVPAPDGRYGRERRGHEQRRSRRRERPPGHDA